MGTTRPAKKRCWGCTPAAAYQISQDYAKTHAPAEAAAFESLHGRYEMNGAFYEDWSKRLIGPQTAAAYSGAEAGLAAAGARFEKAITDEKRKSPADDPTAVAARRCLELGGSTAGCMGKGLAAGFMDMIGFGADVQESLTGPGKAGVVISGLYKNPATVTTLGFDENAVAINDCGKLVADGHNYTVEKGPGSLRITVENEPRPIVLTMRPDGGLTGPGLIDVKGRIIIGYHVETKTVYRNGVPAAPGTCDGPCTSSVRIPDYAPKIDRCVIGSLAMPPSPKATPGSAPPANDSSVVGVLTGLANTFAPGAGEVGLRMTGQYGGGRLLLDFRGNSLILDCGEAHVRQPVHGRKHIERTADPRAEFRRPVHAYGEAGQFSARIWQHGRQRPSGRGDERRRSHVRAARRNL